MKYLFLILAISCSAFFCQAQDYAQSPKLGEEDGFNKFKLDAIFSNDTKGIEKQENLEDAWSEMKNWEYVLNAVYLANPKDFNDADFYGLEIERIELFVNDLDVYDEDFNEVENSFVLNSIEIFIKLPENQKSLDKFYDKITKAYAPMKDSRNEYDEAKFFLWISTTKCGAMMRLQNIDDLDFAKTMETKHLRLIYTSSCGG